MTGSASFREFILGKKSTYSSQLVALKSCVYTHTHSHTHTHTLTHTHSHSHTLTQTHTHTHIHTHQQQQRQNLTPDAQHTLLLLLYLRLTKEEDITKRSDAITGWTVYVVSGTILREMAADDLTRCHTVTVDIHNL